MLVGLCLDLPPMSDRRRRESPGSWLKNQEAVEALVYYETSRTLFNGCPVMNRSMLSRPMAVKSRSVAGSPKPPTCGEMMTLSSSQKRVFDRQRLDRVDVESGARDAPLSQSLNESVLVHQRSAAHVDEDRGWFHGIEFPGAERALRVVEKRQ